MPKFLIESSFTPEGLRGLLKEGGSGRRNAINQVLEGVGGRLESFNFAYGERDSYLIVDVPDAAAAAAIALNVSASGAVHTKTTVLITPEEMDKAVKVKVNYRKPGE